jgi:hypothetical protein
MGRTMRRSLQQIPFLLGSLFAVFACGSKPEPVWPQPETHANDYPTAGVFAGTAAVIYVAGGGCKISDCPTDTVCNPKTERCERLECSNDGLGPSGCPTGTQCNSTSKTCVSF